MRALHCDRMLPNRIYCYAVVLQETCSTSAADIDMLKTIVHNAMFLEVFDRSCTVGESRCCLVISVEPRVGPGHPSSPLSIYFLNFSPFYFSLSFMALPRPIFFFCPSLPFLPE